MTLYQNFPGDPVPESMILSTIEKLKNYGFENPMRWVLVDTTKQRLLLVRERVPLAQWPVSTAQAGLDSRENSGGTPPGVHFIARKIGAEAPLGTVFDSRMPTGEIWSPPWNDDPPRRDQDLILSRILVLEGLESGLNQGPGVDSRERFIYVHGTNREDLIGKPVSHGCVRMTNRHLISLFDQIEEGDPLVIV